MATLPVAAGMGPQPVLPVPQQRLIPTVNIAPATGWPTGQTPRAADGLRVNAFAVALDHPRWLYVLPNGDVLVAETNAPPKPDGASGLRGWVMGLVMKRAGARVPSANRITLLRDTDADGIADQRWVLLEGLNSPFGMALVGDQLFVATTDAVLRFPYESGQTRITAAPIKVTDLPAGPINHHWTKNLIASTDGSKLYVTVGSNSNVAERGMAVEVGRAAIWEVDAKTGEHRIFASGLRNPNGMAWAPGSGTLWTSVNERDELGSDLVPDFALGPHTASLGLASSVGTTLPKFFAQGMFVGQHGSWNRRPHSGYKVIFVPFDAGRPSGKPVDVLTGFLSENGKAFGRPVGVALDRHGAVLVADDVGNVIWRLSAQP